MEGGNFPTRLPSRSGANVPNSAANPNAGAAANPNTGAATNGNNGRRRQQQQRPPMREHEQFLPIANIIRIMRRSVPTHGKISEEAKEAMQECVSEFIGFITSEANEKCQREMRMTVTAEDLLWAMSRFGLDNYVGPLAHYLNRYREIETGRTSLRGEPLVRRRSEFQPPLRMMPPPPPTPPQPMQPPPMYGGWPAFSMGLPPLPGMFDVMGGPMNGAGMGGPMDGPTSGNGSGGYYFVDGSGAGSSSGHPALPEFDPYAKFK